MTESTPTTGASAASAPLDYASSVSGARPTRHPPLVGWAWGMLILETVYRGTLIAVAHVRSPTYPWERFRQNVGNPFLLMLVQDGILVTGIILSLRALTRKGFKRWAAVLALAALCTVLTTKGGVGEMVWQTLFPFNRARE